MAASPQASDPPPPGQRAVCAVVVMGVSGTGKSTVAAGIAAALGLACVDGDDLHTPESVAKMSAGTPLNDDDRWPWLERIGARLCQATGQTLGSAPGPSPDGPAGTVVSCSALKRVYRDRLRAAAPGVRFVFLDGAPDLIRSRMLARRDHYMPPGLLESQLDTLQRPGANEPDVVTLNIATTADALCGAAVAALGRIGADSPPARLTKEAEP
jgi:gluconokinase